MRKRIVSIVTGWGEHLGTGHFQRMTNLTDFINRHTPVRAFIICHHKPAFFPKSLNDFFTDRIKPDSNVIIRDMRDSDINEMEDLKRYGRIIAIDDCGPGRELAGLPIDLLPNLKYSIHKKELFIYGYTFTDSIKRHGDQPVKKNIDYALYCGFNPARKTVDFLLSLLPNNSTCAILSGDDSSLFKKGNLVPLQQSYAETLLSAKVLISHFGISLYEGQIAGCRLISINPTEYHSHLADKAKNDLDIINLGVTDTIDPGQARAIISKSPLNVISDGVYPAAINEIIKKGLNAFYSRIESFINDD